MAISYDQFKIVIQDAAARARLGISLSDVEADNLSTNEAQSIAYYETWNQPAAVQQASLEGKFYGQAIAGFVVSLAGFLVFYASWAPFGFGFIGLCLAGFSLTPIRVGKRRGRGLAIAGVVLGIVDIAFSILQSIIRSSI